MGGIGRKLVRTYLFFSFESTHTFFPSKLKKGHIGGNKSYWSSKHLFGQTEIKIKTLANPHIFPQIRKWLVSNNGVSYYHLFQFTLFEYCNISIITYIVWVMSFQFHISIIALLVGNNYLAVHTIINNRILGF